MAAALQTGKELSTGVEQRLFVECGALAQHGHAARQRGLNRRAERDVVPARKKVDRRADPRRPDHVAALDQAQQMFTLEIFDPRPEADERRTRQSVGLVVVILSRVDGKESAVESRPTQILRALRRSE